MSVMPQYVIVIIAMRIDELSSPETVMIATKYMYSTVRSAAKGIANINQYTTS